MKFSVYSQEHTRWPNKGYKVKGDLNSHNFKMKALDKDLLICMLYFLSNVSSKSFANQPKPRTAFCYFQSDR